MTPDLYVVAVDEPDPVQVVQLDPIGDGPVLLPPADAGWMGARLDALAARLSAVESGGPPAAGASRLVATTTAATVLSGHRVVRPDPGGAHRYAEPTTTADLHAPLRLTLGAAAAGDPVEVLLCGDITEGSWSWTPGPVFLAAAGQLTQTPPTRPDVAVLVRVGVATAATRMFFAPAAPIHLS